MRQKRTKTRSSKQNRHELEGSYDSFSSYDDVFEEQDDFFENKSISRKRRGRSYGTPRWVIPVCAAVAVVAVVVLVGSLLLNRSSEDNVGMQQPVSNVQTEENGTAASVFSITPILVSQPLDGDNSQGSASADMMDFLYYGQSVLNMGDKEASGESLVRDFSGPKEGYDMIKAYVDLLCTEYAFELAGTPYYQNGFFDFVLNYTGSKAGMTRSTTGTFSEIPGNLMIYGTTERSNIKGAIWYDYALQGEDDGYRYGQEGKSETDIGRSLREGLNRIGNTYETTDGRLSAEVGKAMVITDGTAKTYDARYIILADDGQLRVEVMGKNGNVVECLYIPNTEEWVDGIYSAEKFVIDSGFAVLDRGVSDLLPSYTWKTMFTVAHDGNYVYPIRGMSGEMTALSVRVMYQDDDHLVLYTCAGFNTAPREIEALIALDINVSPANRKSGDEEIHPESLDFDNPSITGITTSCVFCSNGEVECTNCNGDGGKKVWDNSTPNYSGSLSGAGSSSTWEKCIKCGGSGKQTCTHCGGTG